ncbi:hypothetical protein [Streptomyces scabiei]|uniref:hypothetical protein n=1 Tax=Streptomyces scabiei TaxID=1930 RepID=UPI0029BB40CA|nr:hypothetical protein [Streptomyces scabiei]MDX3206103.1 hypothetical protein [Streptomyces scabiei]
MSAPVMTAVNARSLVDPLFFARLSARVASANELDQETAEAITDQAIAYLATCAQKPSDAPSYFMCKTVDPAWHAFLEYTKEYDRFFASHGWAKVHHNPCDLPGVDYGDPKVMIPQTLAAIEAAGYRVDRDLWTGDLTCDTCGDDGQPGDPPPCGDHG